MTFKNLAIQMILNLVAHVQKQNLLFQLLNRTHATDFHCDLLKKYKSLMTDSLLWSNGFQGGVSK